MCSVGSGHLGKYLDRQQSELYLPDESDKSIVWTTLGNQEEIY